MPKQKQKTAWLGSNFNKDLKEGEDAEKAFVKVLKGMGQKAVRNQSKTLAGRRAYDVRIVGSGVTFEIKKDRKHVTTGNVYLEHKALLKSRANIIVYLLSDGFYACSLPGVVGLITSGEYQQVKGGDFRDSGTLVPVEKFKNIFKKFGVLQEEPKI